MQWCAGRRGRQKPHIVVDSWPRAAVGQVARSNSLTEWGARAAEAKQLQLQLQLWFWLSFPVALRRVRRGFCNFLLLLFLHFLRLLFFSNAFHTRPNQKRRRVRLADYAVETSANVDIAAKLLGNLNRSIDIGMGVWKVTLKPNTGKNLEIGK